MVALTLTSAVVYLALALGLRRYAHARFRSGLDAKSLRAFVRLGLVDLATHLAAIATLSGVLALGVFELASWHGGTAADLQRAVERVRAVRQLFSEVAGRWSLAGLAVLGVGLAIVTVRRSRTRWREVHARLVERATQRRMQTGDELPPSPTMRVIAGKLEALRADLTARGIVQLDDHPEVAALEQRFADLRLHHVRYHSSLAADSEADPAEFLAPPARTLRQKLARVFVSPGTFAVIRGPRRWLFAAALALMLPSSMYVAGQAGVPRLMQQEIHLEDVRLGLRESTAKARLDAFPVEPPPAWTPRDEAALRRLADLYERSALDDIASHDDLHNIASPVYVRAPTLARIAARESILRELGRDRAMDVHGMARDEASTSTPRLDIGPEAVNGLDAAPEVKPPPGVVEPAPTGNRTVRDLFVEDTREVARQRPKLWAKLRNNIEVFGSEFQQEVSPVAIRRAALSHAIGALLGDPAAITADHVLVIDHAEKRYRAQTAVFLDSVAAGDDAAGVHKAIADLQWEIPHIDLPEVMKDIPSIDGLEQRARNGEFNVWAELRRPSLSKNFETELGRIHAWRTKLDFEPQSVASMVAEYEDHFAVDPTRTSTADRLFKTWGEKVDDRVPALALRRARDFERSGEYISTGGVVFGRTDSEVIGSLDFIDLTWKMDGNLVSLVLVPAKGAPIVLDRLSRDVVRSALGFAADDRKTVVTVVNAAAGVQKVLLHPLLVDTAVGCAVTSLDHVVFDALPSDKDNELSRAFDSYGAALELYKEAYLEYIAQRLGAVEHKLSVEGQAFLDELRIGLTARRDAIERRAPRSADPRTVFRGRKQFSPIVVKALERCVSQPEVAPCIEAELRDRARATSASDLSDLPAGVVTIQPVSGVRESPYQITPTLDFARTADDRLPFSFLAQYAVTAADSNEAKPVVLETAQPAINREVGRWIAAHPAPRDMTIAHSASFARLQRLFRAALAGELGPRFPVDRLVALARAIRSEGRSGRRTAAWVRSEIDVGEFGAALATFAGKLHDVDRGVGDGLARCAELLKTVGRTADLWASAPANRWDAACPQQLIDQTTKLAKEHDEARAAAISLVALHEARELHRTLQSVADRVVRDGGHDFCTH